MDNISQLEILTWRLEEALKILTKLAKKAKKFGNDDISWTVGEPVMRTHHSNITGKPIRVSFTPITIEGSAPQVEGWKFLGKIEFLTTGGVLLSSVTDTEIPAQYRNNPTTFCAHCNTARQRKDVFILENNGMTIQVGRTCLKDFLGTDHPAAALGYFTFLKELKDVEEEFMGLKGGMQYITLQNVLSLTSFSVKMSGYKSSRAEMGSTKDEVLNFMHNDKLWNEVQASYDEHQEFCDAEAQAVIDWVRTVEGGTNYMENLKALFVDDVVYSYNHFGLICSAVSAYQKAMLKEVQAQDPTVEPSDFVGSLGERLKKIKVVLTDKKPVGETFYGELFLIKFLHEGKNEMVWFTGTPKSWNIGEELEVSGTVKDQKEYRGVKQTYLNRVRES
jgi:hypothetical protein